MEGEQIHPPVGRAQKFIALVVALGLLASACGESETTVDPGVTRLLFAAEVDRYGAGAAGRSSEISPPIERPPAARPIGGSFDLREYWGDDLLECGEAPVIEPDGDRPESNSFDLDSELLGLLSTYGEENAEVFGGLWLDGSSTGGLLFAVTDDVVPHLEVLMADLDGDVWQAPFSIVRVRFSESELTSAAQVILDRRFPFVDSASVDLERNRVAIGLFNPTPEDIGELIASVDPNQVCITIAISDVAIGTELNVLPQAGGDTLLTCDETPFPAAALDRLDPLADSDHPAAAAMIALLAADGDDAEPTGDVAAGWIVLSAEPGHALFAKHEAGAIEVSALATPSGAAWELAGWTFGCDLKIGLPEGIGPVQIFHNPSRPLDQAADSIDVLVSEVVCTGGHTMGNRLLGPQVVETDTEVILAFAAVKRPGETFDCPTNPFTSVTVALDGPLAGRRVVNGLHLPPSPLEAP